MLDDKTLGEKQRTHDMFSTTGDVVRQELEFLAASFTARKSKVKDAFTNPTTSDLSLIHI